MAEVTIQELTKQYPGNSEAAVKRVSLSVADGEFMVLLGPSGCGKSSILRMIAGLEPITAGTVAIDRKVVNTIPAKDRDIAMVFQSYALYPHMDVFGNLAFGLRRRKIAAAEIERRVRAVADKLGLSPYLERKPHALSGGQRQRVALGRAIVREPKVFLFDEPLSNLDAALRVSTRNELIRQQQEIGITSIYVTHDQVEAMTMGHRICIMSTGEVVQTGAPLEVYRNPVNIFVARFLGNPPMNLLSTQLVERDGQPWARIGTLEVPLPFWSAALLGTNRRLLLGVRPEDMYEASPRPDDELIVPVNSRVRTVEPLGAETLVGLEIDGESTEIVARLGRNIQFRIGERVTVLLDVRAVHLFDPETTRAVRRDLI
jgi:multiple sugar transport system ATP-binding protein